MKGGYKWKCESAGIQAGQKVDIEKQHVYEEKIRQRPEWSCQTVLWWAVGDQVRHSSASAVAEQGEPDREKTCWRESTNV